MDDLEPLEKMFQRVEEDSERRAQEDILLLQELEEEQRSRNVTEPLTADETRNRRRGSISITRFGQLADGSSRTQSSRTVSSITPQPGFYTTQSANDSTKSFASVASAYANDERAFVEDNNHVTRVTEIAGRPSISKAFSSLIPRRTSSTGSLSRDSNLLIGVSIEEATVESAEGSDVGKTIVHVPGGLRNQNSRLTIAAPTVWVTKKAKGVVQKFRKKNRVVEPDLPSSS